MGRGITAPAPGAIVPGESRPGTGEFYPPRPLRVYYRARNFRESWLPNGALERRKTPPRSESGLSLPRISARPNRRQPDQALPVSFMLSTLRKLIAAARLR